MKIPLRSTLLVVLAGMALSLARAATVQPVPPETMVARLDEAIALTSDQKTKATAILQKQNDAIRALPSATAADPQSEVIYMQHVFAFRAAARSEVRALLTLEQQKKYDHTPPTRGGGQTQNSSARVSQLDAELGLTAEQKKLAAEIYDEEYEELLAFAPEERPAKGQQARQASKALIQALLTSEQQQKLGARRQAEIQRNADEKKELQSLLKNSATIAARIGPIKSFEPTTSSVSDNGKNRSGKATYKVTGERGTEILTAYWEKIPSSGPMKITKLERSNAEAIQP